MKKISVVIGTRPEAIKLAPLVLALNNHKDVSVSVCVTGQHTDMVKSVLDIFRINPDKDFSIMGLTNNLNDLSSILLSRFQKYLTEFKPNVVVVQGDTASVLMGALAAFNLHIPVAHVEAGLRTNDITSPWPEEGYRRMVTQIASYHFTPTKENAKNVKESNIASGIISVTGNTVIDALYIASNIIDEGNVELSIPEDIRNGNRKIVLVTGHRRENFGKGLDNLCSAISGLAKEYKDVDFVFPVHLNPVVQQQVNENLQTSKHDNIKLIAPLPYLEFVWLMKRSNFIITDSGGIQEEAPSLGKPVLVTRDTTERPEGIEFGTVLLVGTSKVSLMTEAKRLLDDQEYYRTMSQAENPYGDGKAAERIIEILLK